MQPQNTDNQRSQVNVPSRSQPILSNDRDAAAQLMRRQIDTIYDETPASSTSPYEKTHSDQTDLAAASSAPATDWNQYHTAWQSYYQQYYERYYLAQLHRRSKEVNPSETTTPAQQAAVTSAAPEEITQDQAVDELRDKLLGEVKTRSEKVRRSRHFMPAVAAITVALVFGMLQYNRLIIAQVKAYVSPGTIDPQNIVLDPTTDTKVGPAPKVVIPKINVDAPVVYDVPSLEESVVQSKLKSGVVHYPIPGADGFPGEKGNTVLLGHSSNDVFDDGAYKFVFVQLDKLSKGDTFYLHYNSTRYTYTVTEKKIIDPTQVSELILGTDKPMATLVTCTPPGTALKRLVVIGEQISPDPDAATTKSSSSATQSKPTTITGNSPTLLERLFGSH